MTISHAIRFLAAAVLTAGALHPSAAAASTQPVETVSKSCAIACSMMVQDCLVGGSLEFCSGMGVGCMVGCTYPH